MALITLNELKQQLNIEQSDTTDDSYLTLLLDTASEMVYNTLRRTPEELLETEGKIPASLKSAALIFATNIYENRSSIAFAQSYVIPDHLAVLLSPYKNFAV